MYKSRLGSKDTQIILSQDKKMDSSPRSHKEKRKHSRRMSKTTPTKNGPEEKKQKLDCSRCEQVLGEINITCTWCKLTLCQPCSKLKESFITPYNEGDLPGIEWKCAPCSLTSSSIQNMDKKLDSMGKTIDGMEDRISDKIKNELPEMIKNEVKGLKDELTKKVETEVKKVEENIGKEIAEKIENVEKKIVETTDTIVKKDEIEGMLREMIKEEMEKNQPTTSQTGTAGTQVSPGTQMKKTVASVTAEIREKAKREKRLVIYNMEENPETNLKTERKNLDKDKFMDIATNT